MANVKGIVKTKFPYKGKMNLPTDVVELSPKAARLYSNLGFVELDKAAEKKVEAAIEKAAEPVKEAPAKGKK